MERKIQTLKKMIKQGVFGTSRPQTESADRSLLETAISGAVSMINCVPYATSETNHLLLTPADTLTPWRGLEPTVQHLPKTKLRSLAEARRLMVIKQERIKEVLMENTRLEVKRFRAGNLKLGKNKSSPQIQVGSVVMLDFEDRPVYGAVISLDERNVRVRAGDGREIETAVGQCIPLTPATSNSNTTMGARTEEPFTHFISLEFNENELKEKFVEKIQKLQETLKSVENIGKAAKASSLHLTIATLNVKDGELDTVLKKAKTVHERFVDLLDAPDGLMVAFNQIGFGDYGALWVNLELGKEAIGCLREMIDESLGVFLTDLRFNSHLTIFRNNKLEEMEKGQVKAAVTGFKLPSLVVDKMTVRERKTGLNVKAPVLQLNFAGFAVSSSACVPSNSDE